MTVPSKLMPLRIPSLWGVFHNRFGDEDPIIKNGEIVNDLFYDDDLLWIEQLQLREEIGWTTASDGYFMDLGWYPSAKPEGSYRLDVFRGTRAVKLLAYRSRQRTIIRDVIEYTLELILLGTKDDDIASRVQEKFGEGL